MNRTQARSEAFKLVFEMQAQPDCIEEILARYQAAGQEDDAQMGYVLKAASGTLDHLAAIDELIEKNLMDGWKISRLSRVSSAILRLAVYEMLYTEDVSNSVAINQAIELAKEFDTDTAPAFINGVLGGVHKCLE